MIIDGRLHRNGRIRGWRGAAVWRAGDGPIAAAGTAAHPRVSDRVPALERRPGIGDGARRQDAVEETLVDGKSSEHGQARGTACHPAGGPLVRRGAQRHRRHSQVRGDPLPWAGIDLGMDPQQLARQLQPTALGATASRVIGRAVCRPPLPDSRIGGRVEQRRQPHRSSRGPISPKRPRRAARHHRLAAIGYMARRVEGITPERMTDAAYHRQGEPRSRLASTIMIDQQRARLRRQREHAAVRKYGPQHAGLVRLVRRDGEGGLAYTTSLDQIEAPVRGALPRRPWKPTAGTPATCEARGA